jgi:hypothetical protein
MEKTAQKHITGSDAYLKLRLEPSSRQTRYTLQTYAQYPQPATTNMHQNVWTTNSAKDKTWCIITQASMCIIFPAERARSGTGSIVKKRWRWPGTTGCCTASNNWHAADQRTQGKVWADCTAALAGHPAILTAPNHHLHMMGLPLWHPPQAEGKGQATTIAWGLANSITLDMPAQRRKSRRPGWGFRPPWYCPSQGAAWGHEQYMILSHTLYLSVHTCGKSQISPYGYYFPHKGLYCRPMNTIDGSN